MYIKIFGAMVIERGSLGTSNEICNMPDLQNCVFYERHSLNGVLIFLDTNVRCSRRSILTNLPSHLSYNFFFYLALNFKKLNWIIFGVILDC